MTARAVVPVAAVAVVFALAGCGMPGAATGSSAPGVTATPGAATTVDPTTGPADSGSLDGISQDLDGATAANSGASADAGAGDQAAAAGDEP